MILYVAIFVFAAALVLFLTAKRHRKTHPVKGGVNRERTLPASDTVELYSNSFSHCSRKTRLVLAELGITAKHHSIELIETGWYQTISPAYLAINPAGLVPTLVHEGHPVYESDDILAYAQSIAAADAPVLIPSNPKLRTQMETWLSFCTISSDDAMAGMAERAGACVPGLTLPIFATSIQYVPLRNILVGLLFHFDRKRPLMFITAKILGLGRMMRIKPVRTLMHTSRDYMSRHLNTLNQTLSEQQPWILGDSFSLADVSIACVLLRLDETGWLDWFASTQNIDNVLAYYQRLRARPAWSEAILNHSHPIVEKARSDLDRARTTDKELAQVIYGADGGA